MGNKENQEKARQAKKEWNDFYDRIGGKYICRECGQILTWFQRDRAGQVKGTEVLLSLAIATPLAFILTPVGAGLFMYIYLEKCAKRKGCPVCTAKQENILPLNSEEGKEIFINKHPDYAHLLPQDQEDTGI